MREVVDGTLAQRSAPQGHGLGLEPRELPFIGPPTTLRLADDIVDLDVDQALEPDMVINLEVPLEWPGHYAVHLERSFLITAGGAEPMLAQDRSSALVAGRP
jgi:Xaa-Pro aminopeptidase